MQKIKSFSVLDQKLLQFTLLISFTNTLYNSTDFNLKADIRLRRFHANFTFFLSKLEFRFELTFSFGTDIQEQRFLTCSISFDYKATKQIVSTRIGSFCVFLSI